MNNTDNSLYGPAVFDLEAANEILCIRCKHCCHNVRKSLQQMRTDDQFACPKCGKAYLREAITAFEEEIIKVLSN